MDYKENGRQQLLITRYAVGLRPGIKKSVILRYDIPSGDLLSSRRFIFPIRKVNLPVVYHQEICFPYWENESPGGEIWYIFKVSLFVGLLL